jgi:hypothetical protein
MYLDKGVDAVGVFRIQEFFIVLARSWKWYSYCV